MKNTENMKFIMMESTTFDELVNNTKPLTRYIK